MARRKNDFVISEEFKKKLLAKLFEGRCTTNGKEGVLEKYIGYYGETPLEVSFWKGVMDITRLDKLKRGISNNQSNREILSEVLGRELEEVKDMQYEDYNQDLVARVICYNHGASLVFERKQKEDAA